LTTAVLYAFRRPARLEEEEEEIHFCSSHLGLIKMDEDGLEFSTQGFDVEHTRVEPRLQA
jgi:hypothetical protein